MRYLWTILMLSLMTSTGISAGKENNNNAMLLDGVAAYVNSDMITISEVMMEVRRSPWASDVSASQREKRLREMYNATLNALIDRNLILDAARKSKLELQSWAVDNRVREIVANNFGGDRTELHQLLADRKITFEEWKQNLEEDLTISAMRYQKVDSHVNPTPKEIRAEYEANKGRYQTQKAVAVSMIILDPPQDDEKSVKERAKEIEEKLAEGVSFAELARVYSNDAKASQGGAWGKVNPEDVFRKEIVNALDSLKPGETSPVIILDDYGYIVRKDEQQDGRALTFEEAAPYVENRLRMKQSEKLYRKWMKRLREEAYVKIFELPSM
ncbi:MAG: peptidyl-prolyl cis-trans isomerase [Kiritimatiellia bacterium]